MSTSPSRVPTVTELGDLIYRTNAALRRLDYELRRGPRNEAHGRRLVTRIRTLEAIDRELRRQLHAHPDHHYSGL